MSFLKAKAKALESIGLLVQTNAPVVLTKIDPDIAAKIEQQVGLYVGKLVTLDPSSAQFEAEIASVHHLGDNEIKAATLTSNRLLEKPPAAMSIGKFEAYAKIPTGLQELRALVTKLDPINQGLLEEGGWFSKFKKKLPFGDALTAYVKKYDSAQNHLTAIVKSLESGSAGLKEANRSLGQEQSELWKIKGHLEECAYMVSSLEVQLTSKIKDLKGSDPILAKKLEEDALFYIKQKHQDILTQIAVSGQSILAMEVIQKNNFELIKGVDRTTTTTVSALRTGVIVTQALYHQGHVLGQIKAINGTASNLIEKTSLLLKGQSGAIHDQASAAALDVDKLKASSDNVYEAIDTLDAFRVQALQTMDKTLLVLNDQIGRARIRLSQSVPQELPEPYTTIQIEEKNDAERQSL
jgi:uncharacterized protein YaaN involved in tellurite resistance